MDELDGPVRDGSAESGDTGATARIDEFPTAQFLQRDPRGKAADTIAQNIVAAFGVSLGGTLFAIFIFLGICAWKGYKSEEVSKLAKDAVMPLLGAVGTFITTIFGPLLAFVLGYYFGEKRK